MRLFGRSIVLPAVAGTEEGYTDDLLTGGTPSADSVWQAGYEASKACDDNNGTYWCSLNTVYPHWWKYDFGAGITKTIAKITILGYWVANGLYIKDFKLQGSNDDSDWTDIYTGQTANNANKQEFTFANANAYRYYRIYATSTWNTVDYNFCAVCEFEMMESIPATPGVAAVEGLVSLPLVFGWYDNFYVQISQSAAPNGYGFKVSDPVPAGELWVCTAAYYYFDTQGSVGYLAIEMNSGQTNHMAGQNDLVLGRFYFWNGFRTLPPGSEFAIEWSGVSGSPHIVGRFSGYKMKLE
jgi:hypothetical protein